MKPVDFSLVNDLDGDGTPNQCTGTLAGRTQRGYKWIHIVIKLPKLDLTTDAE